MSYLRHWPAKCEQATIYWASANHKDFLMLDIYACETGSSKYCFDSNYKKQSLKDLYLNCSLIPASARKACAKQKAITTDNLNIIFPSILQVFQLFLIFSPLLSKIERVHGWCGECMLLYSVNANEHAVGRRKDDTNWTWIELIDGSV